MINNEIIHTICPCCGGNCYMVEESDGNGSIIPIFSQDRRWLEDSEESAMVLEQGSESPNAYGAG